MYILHVLTEFNKEIIIMIIIIIIIIIITFAHINFVIFPQERIRVYVDPFP